MIQDGKARMSFFREFVLRLDGSTDFESAFRLSTGSSVGSIMSKPDSPSRPSTSLSLPRIVQPCVSTYTYNACYCWPGLTGWGVEYDARYYYTKRILIHGNITIESKAMQQGQTNNKAKQHSTPKAVTFPRKNELPRVRLEPTTLYTLDRALYH